MQSVLEFRQVYKSFQSNAGNVPVLRDVSFSIEPGEFYAVTGPSGSGKSTLLHLAALLDRPTGGSVFFQQQSVNAMNDDAVCDLRKTGIGLVFQQFHLLPQRTALDNVLFRYRYLDEDLQSARKQALDALHRLGLEHAAHRPARVLSGGEMQRLAIARAIVVPPTILIADEPTGNLDQDNAELVMRYFDSLHQDGQTILLATHNPALLSSSVQRWNCVGGGIEAAA